MLSIMPGSIRSSKYYNDYMLKFGLENAGKHQ